MDPGPGGEQEGEVGVGGNGGKDDADDATFVSFSLETETKEPWPPLLSLGNVMLDPNPH